MVVMMVTMSSQSVLSLEVAGHGAVQKLGDTDVVIVGVMLEVELDHERVVVLVDGHVVVLS